MNDLVNVIDGKVFANSKQVTDRFSVAGGHRYITKKIRELIDSTGEFGVQNYLHSNYKSLQNKNLDCFEMTRDGFVLLVMGLTGKEAIDWKIKYLTAFNDMEKMLSGEQSVMKQLNIAVKIMSEDKAIASKCGIGLNKWKEARKDHIAKIEDLNKKAQLLSNFK